MGMGGAMDSCGRCMKFSLICINVITLIGGAIALAIGLWVWTSRSFSSTLMSNNMFIASVGVVVAMGVAIMILSLLGCCGAAKEVKCMLLTYYILVFIIFVVMLVGGILQFVFREKVLTTLDRELYASVPYYGVKHEYTKSWDDTQTYLQCCGVKSPNDWHGNLPESCCREAYPGKRIDCKSNQNPTTIYVDGCLDKVIEFLREDAVYVGTAAIIVAIIMLLALILSCGLFVKIE
ncbi:tetraspanin-9-like isoform X2 [Bombyx mandarina]|uniref:Tetraspanin n=3 Tax=Bombyx TaxID=7090 RepID=A0A8R2HNF0_BOMMO|nr:tetraspanin-9 isoform X2 [Bombyx mori]XP_021204860.2 tetraspanin-9 isoform X2 [Bombyx mori]XP_021204861.2 tetraspanin-9 isoform X2 [Bombyx mori]XP_028043075.1 tetraspanin-9-like isoform X2 [Bombyx mandarina]XP_028043076.1 tetraspanin-9-like isoform X2 [Bombyx mandarina]